MTKYCFGDISLLDAGIGHRSVRERHVQRNGVYRIDDGVGHTVVGAVYRGV